MKRREPTNEELTQKMMNLIRQGHTPKALLVIKYLEGYSVDHELLTDDEFFALVDAGDVGMIADMSDQSIDPLKHIP